MPYVQITNSFAKMQYNVRNIYEMTSTNQQQSNHYHSSQVQSYIHRKNVLGNWYIPT